MSEEGDLLAVVLSERLYADQDSVRLAIILVSESEGARYQVVGKIWSKGELRLGVDNEALLASLVGDVEEEVVGAPVLCGSHLCLLLMSRRSGTKIGACIARVVLNLLAEGVGGSTGVVQLALGLEFFKDGDERVGRRGRCTRAGVTELGVHVNEGVS